jgi:hypothetical protein
MEKNRSLQCNYSFEALPILFHSQTSGFMKYLEKDGVNFLKFWWNHVGDQLEEGKRALPTGLTFEVDIHDERTKIIYITLPTPKEDGDGIFLAFVARPERRFAWVRIPNTEAYILSRYDDSKTLNKTAFGLLSPRAIYRQLGEGLSPNKADFKRIVKNKVEKKKTEKKK